ncbi:MAG: universal stress protein [Bacteroidota bacterium]
MNYSDRDTLLVPTDFTSVADCAIDHAIEIANLFKHKICLLHIVNKKMPEEDKKKALNHLKKVANFTHERSGLAVSVRLEEGSIFDKISQVANEINAEFILMGIHGKKGLQHLLGSYFYKVILSSQVPVLVVKKKHHHVGYNNIVVPVDFSYESTQKVNEAIRFAKYFDSVIHVIGVIRSTSAVYKINKEALLKNLNDYISKYGVKVHTEVLIKPGSSIEDEILEYAENVDADLVMIAINKDKKSDMPGKNDAENIIDKAEMPVLTVFPPEDSDDDSTLFSTFIDPLGLMQKDK